MSEANDLTLIGACLWDLRAQHEERLRKLAAAQRLLEQFARVPAAQRDVRQQLLAEVERTLDGSTDLREASQECLKIVRRLRPGTEAGE